MLGALTTSTMPMIVMVHGAFADASGVRGRAARAVTHPRPSGCGCCSPRRPMADGGCEGTRIPTPNWWPRCGVNWLRLCKPRCYGALTVGASSFAGFGQGKFGVHRSDRGCSFADRRGHALHRPEPDVARGEDAWNRGFEGQGPASQCFPAQSEIMVEPGIGANETGLVGGDVRQPRRVGQRTDE